MIVLLVSALLLSSPYLAFAAVLSLAIPKLGEKLYSIFSSGDGINPNSQATREMAILVNDREMKPVDQASNVGKNTIFGAFFNRKRGGPETEEQIMVQGTAETNLKIQSGKSIKG